MTRALTRAAATACEKARGGRCRCGGVLHGAGRTDDTARLPLGDPHRTDLTARERQELAEIWAAEAELELEPAGCTPVDEPGEQLQLFRAVAVPRSGTAVDASPLRLLPAADGRLGTSKQIHAHRNEGI
jgi:hypothetical protein